MHDDAPQQQARRRFLRTSLAVGLGGSAVVAAGASAASVPDAGAAPASDTPSSSAKGYHMTPHIADYYRTAGF